MSLWRRTRNEVAGAWRSVRYDMGRRTPDDAGGPPAPGPAADVTSTGMNTFAGAAAEPQRSEQFTGYVRPPRRVLAVSAFGVFAVLGVAGSYFAVVGGLGGVLNPAPAPAPYPLAAAAPTPGPGDDVDAVAGMGRGTVVAPGQAAPLPPGALPPGAVPAAGVVTVTVPGAVPGQAPPAAAPARGPRPPAPGTPGSSDCDCLTPPVPTPTAPPSASPDPSPPADPDPTRSDSEPTPTGEPTETPAAEPSGSGGGGPARPHRPGHRY